VAAHVPLDDLARHVEPDPRPALLRREVGLEESAHHGLWDAAAAPGLPGPVTVDGTVAVRVPGSDLARDLCRHAGGPVVSTSANPSGGAPPAEVEALDPWLLDRIDLVLDGGRTPGGLPSTVVDLSGPRPRLVRAGAVPWAAVEAALGRPLPSRDG